MGSVTGRKGRERGATLVEFAVIAPLLFLLIFGVIEFSRAVSAYTTVWTGAREGARYATTSAESDLVPTVPRFRDCVGIEDAVMAKAVTSNIASSDITIEWLNDAGVVIADCDPATAAPDPGTRSGGVWVVDIDPGTRISVEVTGQFNAVVPLLSSVLNGISLDSTQTRSIYEGIVGAS